MVNEFGKLVKAKRTEIHITQKQLAYWTSTSVQLIRAIEQGTHTNPSMKTVFSICKFLDIDLNDLKE